MTVVDKAKRQLAERLADQKRHALVRAIESAQNIEIDKIRARLRKESGISRLERRRDEAKKRQYEIQTQLDQFTAKLEEVVKEQTQEIRRQAAEAIAKANKMGSDAVTAIWHEQLPPTLQKVVDSIPSSPIEFKRLTGTPLDLPKLTVDVVASY